MSGAAGLRAYGPPLEGDGLRLPLAGCPGCVMSGVVVEAGVGWGFASLTLGILILAGNWAEETSGMYVTTSKEKTTTLSFDTKLNMVVSQEFTAEDGSVTVKYEMRNIKLEVDDELFQVPAGYRKVDPPARR